MITTIQLLQHLRYTKTYGRSLGKYCSRTCSRSGKNSRKQLGHPLQKMIGIASFRSEKRAIKWIVCSVPSTLTLAVYWGCWLIRFSTWRLISDHLHRCITEDIPVEVHPCLSSFNEPFSSYSIILRMGFWILKSLLRDPSMFKNHLQVVQLLLRDSYFEWLDLDSGLVGQGSIRLWHVNEILYPDWVKWSRLDSSYWCMTAMTGRPVSFTEQPTTRRYSILLLGPNFHTQAPDFTFSKNVCLSLSPVCQAVVSNPLTALFTISWSVWCSRVVTLLYLLLKVNPEFTLRRVPALMAKG